jgi:hypothetical protein
VIGGGTRTAALLAALGAALAAPLPAQGGGKFHPLIETGAASLQERSRLGASTLTWRGTTLGADARVRVGPVGLTVGYWQGSLSPQAGTGGASPDVVEGRVLLGVRIAGGLALQGGPFARAYVTAAGTQRWLLWRVQARVESQLVPDRAQTFVSLWQVVSADVNVVEPFDKGRGGEAGLLLRLGHSPLWARLSYNIEQIRMGGGARLETVDRVAVAVALGRP